MLTKLANCGRNRANVCRNLHALIHKTGLTLNVETSVVEDTPVVVMCGKPGVRRVNFPCLHLSSWAKALFKRGGKALLGGFTLDQETEFRELFADFWCKFKCTRPEMAQELSRFDGDGSIIIPTAIHGDEGRGKTRKPIMIIGHQCIISPQGPSKTNLSGCPACTQMVAGRSCTGTNLFKVKGLGPGIGLI